MYLCILRAQELGDLAQTSRYSYWNTFNLWNVHTNWLNLVLSATNVIPFSCTFQFTVCPVNMQLCQGSR
jgi:hypothetical protein